MPPKAAAHALAHAEANPPPPFEVWDEHWKTLLLFCRAARRCWTFSMGGPVCFDFKKVRHEAKRASIKLTRHREADLETMETEALRQIEEKHKKD